MPPPAGMIIRIAANIEELKRNLAEGKVQIETTTAAMGKIVSSFQGDRLIQQAHNVTAAVQQIGGVTRLTGAEQQRLGALVDRALEKYRLLGREAPEAMRSLGAQLRQIREEQERNTQRTEGWSSQLKNLAGTLGIVFSVGAVINFGREILAMGDDIQKTADRTGLMTDEVQRLQFIATQSGNTLDELTGAIGQMQNRLASGDASAIAALKTMNLTFDDLKDKDPYEQLQLIARAVAQIPNPANQAQVAMDLFGRTGIAILPTLKSEFDKLGAAAPVMSDKTIKALDAAGDSLDRFKLTAKVWAAEAYNYLGRMFDLGLAAIYRYIAGLLESIAKIESAIAKLPGAARAFPTLANDIKGLTERAQWFRDAATMMEKPMAQVGATAERVIIPMEQLTKATKTSADTTRTATTSHKEHAEAVQTDAHVLELLKLAHEHAAAAMKISEAAARANFAALADYAKNLPTAILGDVTDFSGRFNELIVAAASHPPPVPAPVKQGLFESIFGSPAEFGQRLAGSILAAIQGGGDAIKAAGATIGAQLGTSIGKSLQEHFSKEGAGALSKALGGMFAAVLPAVGSLLGPLVSGIWNHFFGTAGRDLVKDFAASFGGFDALHAKLNELGAAGEQLWIRLTQGVGRNNPDQARAAIDAVNAALAAQKTKSEEAAAAATEQANAISEAQRQAQAVVDGLTSKIEGLYDSIKDEAPEQVMGDVEKAVRAQIASIEQQRDAAQAAIDQTSEQAAIAANKAADIIDETLAARDWVIKVRGELTGVSGLDQVPGFAQGTHGQYYDFGRASLAVLHGREKITPINDRSSDGGGDIVINLTNEMDGEVLLERIVRVARRKVGR